MWFIVHSANYEARCKNVINITVSLLYCQNSQHFHNGMEQQLVTGPKTLNTDDKRRIRYSLKYIC